MPDATLPPSHRTPPVGLKSSSFRPSSFVLRPFSFVLRPSSFVLTLCLFLFFFQLGDRSLSSSHEARAAQNAQTILRTGQWLLPALYDRQVELQKPPLYYWLVALLAQVFQRGHVDAWMVRLPAALSGLSCVLFLYAFCVRQGRPGTGFLAATALATCLHFTWLARVARIDMPLTLAITIALLSFYQGETNRRNPQQKSWPWFFLGYLALGFGLLLKGPIAVVLPLTVGMGLIAEKIRPRVVGCGKVKTLPRDAACGRGSACHVLWGVLLMLLIAAPWYMLANRATEGELFRVFFWYHNVARGLGGAEQLEAHPWWYYGPRIAIDLFPWSLLFPLACWHYFRRKLWKEDRLAHFGLLWFISMLVLLSCVRFKRADYLLPAYPGFALFLGCVWRGRSVFCDPISRHQQLASCAWLAIVIACVVGWGMFVAWILPAQETHRPTERFAQAIRRQTTGWVIFFRVEAHDLAFHTGPPVETLLEWENLDTWTTYPMDVYVVMSIQDAEQWHHHITKGRLVEVVRTSQFAPEDIERPLVLFKAVKR